MLDYLLGALTTFLIFCIWLFLIDPGEEMYMRGATDALNHPEKFSVIYNVQISNGDTIKIDTIIARK